MAPWDALVLAPTCVGAKITAGFRGLYAPIGCANPDAVTQIAKSLQVAMMVGMRVPTTED